MKLETLGKIQIGIAVFFFVAVLIINILVYSSFQTAENKMTAIMNLPQIFQQGAQKQNNDLSADTKIILQSSTISTLYTFGGVAVLFAEILIASDIIILLIISMLIIDGAGMLAKN